MLQLGDKYSVAWSIDNIIMHVMKEHDYVTTLSELFQVDDVY